MPTLNPRITITLTPEVHAILKRMSQLTGNSQSAIVGDLLSSSAEVFARVVAVLEAAEVARGTVNEEIKAGLSRAQDRLEQQLGLVMEAVDESARPLLEAAERASTKKAGASGRAGARTGGAAVRRGSTPVPVTRGSGTPERPKSGQGTSSAPVAETKAGQKTAGGKRGRA